MNGGRRDGDAPVVRNASNPREVARGKRLEERRRERELGDLRAVLTTEEGRRVIWRLLEHCAVFQSIWHPSALIHHNAGRQDVGHFLMAEVQEADELAYFEMAREARANRLREEDENEAGRTRSVTEEQEP